MNWNLEGKLGDQAAFGQKRQASGFRVKAVSVTHFCGKLGDQAAYGGSVPTQFPPQKWVKLTVLP